MLFSIVIPTRNRPGLFKDALDSVLMQAGAEVDVIVVNDGSDADHLPAYAAIAATAPPHVRFLALPRTVHGHGQSYALNWGVEHATGDYVGFLDDDDCWTDPGYLARAAATIAARDEAVDVLLANQAAYRAGTMVAGPVWIEDLAARLPADSADAGGAVRVSVPLLLTAHGFGHLNVTLLRRAHFAAIGGLDNNIRYECDRDFYLRAIDRAALITYSPAVVSRHNIPDPKQRSNMSTAVSELEKRLFQLRVLDKAVLFATQPALRAYARRHKAYVLKSIAQTLAGAGQVGAAAFYAREALAIGFGAKWAAYTAWLGLRAARVRSPGARH